MAEENFKYQAKKAVIWSTLGSISNQAMQFAIGIVLARLLSPSDYGTIALPTIFLAIAQCFIDSGFGSALIRKPQITEEDLSTAFYFNICVGIFFYALLFLCSPLIADFYNAPILKDILRVTALSTLFGPLQSVHFSQFSRKMDFKTPAKISLSSKFTTGIVGIILAFMGLGVWALVFQGVAGSLLSLTLVWTLSPWRPRAKWSNESFHYLFGFGSKLLGSKILDVLYNNIIPVTLGKFYSPDVLGVFNRGYGYAALPYNQLNGMLGPVFFPMFSKLQNDKDELFNYFRKVLRLLIFILAPLNLLLCALAKPLILFMITDKWADCIIVMQLMSISIILWPIQSLNTSLFSAMGHSEMVLKSNVVVKVLGLTTLLASLPFGLVAICATGILRSVLNVSWVAHYAGNISNFGAIKQFKEICPSLALSTCMCVFVLFVNSYLQSYFLQIAIGGSIGVLFYLFFAKVFNFPELNDIKLLLKNRKK